MFYAPGAAYSIAGRLGLGWLARSAVAGAAATTTFRGVQDTFEGEFSGVFAYVFDAITGAVIGVITAGGIMILRDRMCVAADWLASHGMRLFDIAITQRLAERAAQGPINAAQMEAIMGRRDLYGRLAQHWMQRRGLIILYRGQGGQTVEILSPIAREQGVATSQMMEARLRAAGLTSEEIAGYMARWHSTPVPGFLAPPGLAGEPLGGIGIPTTRIPGIAANFGETGVVYTIRLPAGSAIRVPHWGLALENEFAVLHRIPQDSIVSITPASRIPALTIDDAGRMVLAGN